MGEREARQAVKEGKDGTVERTDSTPFAGSAGMLIVLQACSRVVTMLFAQLQVRLTSAETFGVAHIHLELLLGTILTLSRQGVRDALSRATVHGSKAQRRSEQSIRNIAILPIPIGLLVACACMAIYRTRLAPKNLIDHPHFGGASTLFLAGVVLELMCEPLFVAAIRSLHLGPRIWAEGVGTIAKGASTLAVMLYLQRVQVDVDAGQQSLLPFGVGQFCFGAAFLLVFLADSIRRSGTRQTASLYVFRFLGKQSLDSSMASLSVSMTRQNVVKHILGEADKFAVARLTSLEEQGAYALASNYGSLIARVLYQPVEESARLTFAATLGDATDKPTNEATDTAQTLLRSLLSFYVLFSLFLVTFCPPLTTPLLVFIAGQRWALQTAAPRILAVYGATYVPAMAFNGLLEGFLQASASPAQLTRYDVVLMTTSATYVGAVAVLMRTELVSAEVGLVLASSMSSWMRAVYSFRFATHFFRRSEQKEGSFPLTLRNVMPRPTFVLSIFVASFVLVASTSRIAQSDWQWPWRGAAAQHVLIGVSFAIICAVTCISTERSTLFDALHAISGRKTSKVA